MSLQSIAGSIIESCLGPNKCNKIVLHENGSHICRCSLSFFQKIHFKNPLSSLVEETLYSHHELYGCSTLTLLAMWYFWQEEFLRAIKDGCQIQDIIMHSQNTLKNVASALINICVTMDNLFIYKPHEIDKTLDKIPIAVQFSSRHFSPSQSFVNSGDEKCNKRNKKIEEYCLSDIISKLDHDEDVEVANLVYECWRKQLSLNCSKFNTDGLLVCPINLPCSSSTVLDGLVLKNKLNPLYYKDMKKTGKNKTLVIKGSITFEYIHLGFSPKVSVSLQKSPEELLISEKEAWRKKCCQMILDLDVDILLVKDDIDPDIQNFCQSYSIIVLSHIPWNALKIICRSLQYSPCTYLLDCDKESVIENLTIKEWKPDDASSLRDQYFHLDLYSKNRVLFQTIILCHPSQLILENKEHQLWHLLSRVCLASNNNKLLPGGGKSEEWCSIYLGKLLHNKNLNGPIATVITAMKNGYESYYSLVSRKKSMNICKETFDDMASKLSAWYSAMSLVLLTLQCNTALINGTDGLTHL